MPTKQEPGMKPYKSKPGKARKFYIRIQNITLIETLRILAVLSILGGTFWKFGGPLVKMAIAAELGPIIQREMAPKLYQLERRQYETQRMIWELYQRGRPRTFSSPRAHTRRFRGFKRPVPPVPPKLK